MNDSQLVGVIQKFYFYQSFYIKQLLEAQKKWKKYAIAFLVICFSLITTNTTFATDYSGDIVKPGLSNIQPNDTISFPENTHQASLTAAWGVRVTYVDGRNAKLKSVIVPEGGNTTAPEAPAESGHNFLGWVLRSDNGSSVTFDDEGNVISVDGAGPIIVQATYDPQITDISNEPENVKPTPGSAVIPEPPKTADESHVVLWLLLLIFTLATLVGVTVTTSKGRVRPHRKIAINCNEDTNNRTQCNGIHTTKHKKLLIFLLAFIVAVSNCPTSYALHNYSMTYLPGTNSKVTNLPEEEYNLVDCNIYTVSNVVPQREGYEFMGWTLDFHTIQTVGVEVRHIDLDTGEEIVPHEYWDNMEVGTTIRLYAKDIEGYMPIDDTMDFTVTGYNDPNIVYFLYYYES